MIAAAVEGAISIAAEVVVEAVEVLMMAAEVEVTVVEEAAATIEVAGDAEDYSNWPTVQDRQVRARGT